jgi:DNA polymerase III subunit epsilon
MSGETTSPSTMPRFVVIDVETSGLSARRDRILQVAAVEVDSSGGVVNEWSSFVRPRFGRVGPTHVHGLTAASLRSAPAFRVVAPELAKQLEGAVVVGHNIDFDWAFVRRSLKRSRVALAPTARLCTLDLSRSLDPDRLMRHKLADICSRLDVPLDNAHDALADARATAQVLGHLLQSAQLDGSTLSSHRAYRSTTNPGRPRRKKRWWRRFKRQR